MPYKDRFIFTFFVAAILLSAGAARALVFSYDRFKNECFDSAGNVGRNPGFVGECGQLKDMDFSGKDLSKLNLKGADFSGAILKGANLTKADLRGTNLQYANWRGTIFNGALYSKETALPFNDPRAKGMVKVEYSELDSSLKSEVAKILNDENPISVPAKIVEFTDLGADLLQGKAELFRQALDAGHLGLVKFFLSRGVSANISWVASESNYSNPLSYLLRYPVNGRPYYTTLAILLLDNGADPNASSLLSPLTLAIKAKQDKLVRELVKRGAKVDVCSREYGCSNLELALQNFMEQVAILLVDSGADVTKCFSARTLLDLSDHPQVLSRLLSAGLSAKDAQIWNRNNPEAIRLLVSKGADLNDYDPKTGASLAIRAAKERNRELLSTCFQLNCHVLVTDSDGISPAEHLLLVDSDLFVDSLDQFIARGLDPDDKIKKNGLPMIWYAIENEQRNVLKKLIISGANVNKAPPGKDQSPFTAFMTIRKYFFDPSIAKLMIDHGANVDIGYRYASTDHHARVAICATAFHGDEPEGIKHLRFDCYEPLVKVIGSLLVEILDVDPRRVPSNGHDSVEAIRRAQFLIDNGANPNGLPGMMNPLSQLTHFLYSKYFHIHYDYSSESLRKVYEYFKAVQGLGLQFDHRSPFGVVSRYVADMITGPIFYQAGLNYERDSSFLAFRADLESGGEFDRIDPRDGWHLSHLIMNNFSSGVLPITKRWEMVKRFFGEKVPNFTYHGGKKVGYGWLGSFLTQKKSYDKWDIEPGFTAIIKNLIDQGVYDPKEENEARDRELPGLLTMAKGWGKSDELVNLLKNHGVMD